MTYLYKPRHSNDPRAPRSRRLPIAAASAVLAAAAVAGGVAVQQSATPARASDAQALTAAQSSAGATGPAALDKQRTQAAPDAASRGRTTKAPAATPAKPPATTAAAPPPAAATTAAQAPAPPAEKLLSYQFAWQENGYFCGPAATRIALSARGVTPAQSQIAEVLGTTVNGTDSADNVTRGLNQYLNTSFYKSRFITGQAATQADVDQLQATVVNAISHGYAVVANIAGSTVDEKGNSHSYPGGHFLTVVGYGGGGQSVTIADPADAQGIGSYQLTTVKLANWIALRGYSG